MDRLELQKLRDLPIEGVAERLGIQVTMHHKALCPFHEDHHPSLSFSLRKNTYRCFVCGAHGDVIDLVMHRLGKSFPDACRWLADEHNIIISERKPQELTPPLSHREGAGVSLFDASRYARYFEHPWLNDEARRFLFEERHLDERVVRWCRLTSWRDRQGTPWLQIPYYSQEGRLVGVQNRNLAEGHPRFRFPAGSRCGIYNLPVLNRLREGDQLWITEGCSDCWAMLSSGHKAIAIPSATLLTHEDKELLTSNLSLGSAALHSKEPLTSNLHMYPDHDAPGERLFMQLKELLPSLQHHQLPPECKDYSDYFLLKKVGKKFA